MYSLPLSNLGSLTIITLAKIKCIFFLNIGFYQFSHSVVSDSLWTYGLHHTRLPCLSITNSWSLFKLTSIGSMMPYNHLILGRPLLLLPSVPPSIRIFSNKSTLRMRWPKYWSFSFSVIINIYIYLGVRMCMSVCVCVYIYICC